ncbi:MAG: hypothetical protein GX603_08260 [Chloroflexi bacterium]|mgnify:FL=1|nr:hypothetical protein [Chloroflexota bacterium]
MLLKKTANIWAPILIILVMVGLTVLNYNLDQQIQLHDQFAARWNAARSWMSEGWSPYSEETRQATLEVLNDNNSLPNQRDQGYFLDPAWYIYLLIPISFIRYPIAKAIWMMLTQASIIVSVLVSIRLSGIKLKGIEIFLTCLVIALIYPFVRASLEASLAPFAIMMTLLAIRAALEGKGNQSGLLFLLAIWFNPLAFFTLIFLAIYLGSRRDNEMIRIFMIGFAFLLVTSLILFPNWIPEWFASLVRLEPGIDWLNTPLMGIARAFPGAYRQIAIGLHLFAFIMLLVEWYGLGSRNERGVQWKLMLTLIVSYFFNLFSDGAYLLLALPAFFAIFKYLTEKWTVSGKILYWISILIIAYLSWRLVPDPLGGFPQAHAVTISLIPFVVFVGLQYFRWWALASPRALVESNN